MKPISIFNKKHMPIRPTTLFVLFIFLFGCKKDKRDSEAPVIVFELPASSSVYNFNDYIPIKARITDDQEIRTLTVQVTNASNEVFLQTLNYRDEGTDKKLETFIQHNGQFLETGEYYIRITASDGDNETVAYQPIILNEWPKSLMKFFTFSSNIGNSFQVDTLYGGSLANVASVFSDYGQGMIDSRNHTFLLGNRYGGFILTYDLLALTPLSGMSTNQTTTENITSKFADNRSSEYFFGSGDGRIWRIDRNQQVQSVVSNISTAPVRSLCVTENFIYALEKNTLSNNNALNVYHRSSGVLFQNVVVPIDVVGMTMLENEDRILLVGNDTDAHFMIYDNPSNSVNDVFNFYNQNIAHALWPASQGNFYVLHSNGISYYQNNLTNYSTGLYLDATNASYESLSHKLYVAAFDGLHILDENASTELSFYTAGIPCLDVLFEYNK